MPNRPHQKKPIASAVVETVAAFVWTIMLLAVLLAVAFMWGCIQVDKSVHVYALPHSQVHTTTINTSETKADGNTLDAEGGIDLLP